MATIRQLRGRWQAMVRRRGVPPRCKSFDKRTDATRWARELEAEADRSGWVADTRLAEKTTLGELLTRYRDHVSPTKRSAHTGASRINAMLRRPIVHRTLAKLASADIATYRDERLKDAAPATVVRELNTISHAIETALREWGLWLPRNPVKMVRRPSVPQGRKRRLTILHSATAKPGKDKRIEQLCGREIMIMSVWAAMQHARLIHGPGVTDAQVAETFEGLGSGHFTRHQARSYRLLFTFACPALFEDVLNILHENRSLRGGLAAGATMAFLVFQAAAARARLVSADLCHVQV